MRMRKLGALEVSELGFGVLSFASAHVASAEWKPRASASARGYHDLGVTRFDTAEIYGPWTNEALLGEALAPVRDEVVIATKFGFDVDPATGERLGLNSRPERIKRATDAMLRRLGTSHIDLLYQHRVDPNVPIEDVAGAVKDLDRGRASAPLRSFGSSAGHHPPRPAPSSLSPPSKANTRCGPATRNLRCCCLGAELGIEASALGPAAWDPATRPARLRVRRASMRTTCARDPHASLPRRWRPTSL